MDRQTDQVKDLEGRPRQGQRNAPRVATRTVIGPRSDLEAALAGRQIEGSLGTRWAEVAAEGPLVRRWQGVAQETQRLPSILVPVEGKSPSQGRRTPRGRVAVDPHTVAAPFACDQVRSILQLVVIRRAGRWNRWSSGCSTENYEEEDRRLRTPKCTSRRHGGGPDRCGRGGGTFASVRGRFGGRGLVSPGPPKGLMPCRQVGREA